MTTPTSSFEPKRFVPLYKSILRQNRGYFGLLTAIVLLFYPLQYILEVFTANREDTFLPNALPQYHIFGMGNNYTAVACGMLCAVLLLGAFTLALKLNSYLFSKKAVDVYHALPVTRSTLVLANAAAAMTMLWAPLLLSNVVIAVSAVVKFGAANAHLGGLLLDTVFWFVITLAIYLVVTVVCTQVGTSFDAFFHSGVLLFALPTVCAIFLWLCATYLYGFQFGDDMARLLSYLSPVLLVINHFVIGVQIQYDLATVEYMHYFNTHWMVVGVYTVLCIFMVWFVCRLYARRQSERAEVASSAGFVPLIVQLVGTYVGGIMLGMLFRSIEDLNGKDGFAAMITWSIVGAAVTFVILDVIFNRGFKSLKKHTPMGAGMVGVMLLSLAVVMTGLFGFETRIPNPATVESVTINGSLVNNDYAIGQTRLNGDGTVGVDYRRELTLADQPAIDYVTQFHEVTAANPTEEYLNDEAEQYPRVSGSMKLQYRLKNGRTMVRMYNSMPVEAGLKLMPLLTNGEYASKTTPAFVADPALVTACAVYDGLGGGKRDVNLTKEQYAELLKAMQQDRLAMTTEMLTEPAVTPKAFLRLIIGEPKIVGIPYTDGVFYAVSALTPHTLRMLEDLELLPSAPDLTNVVAVSGEIINRTNGAGVNFPEREQFGSDYHMQEGLLTSAGNYDRNLADVKRAWENMDEEFGYNDDALSVDAEKAQEMFNEMAIMAEKYGVFLLIEDPAVIARLAELARSSWRGDEPAMKAVFHLADESEDVAVVIPLSLMDKADLDAMQYSPK